MRGAGEPAMGHIKWSLVGEGMERKWEVEQYPDSSSKIVPSGVDSP